ncbi:hypothetical protein [Phenylobacterium zucineum]|uniref:hypothetical protein n=1 Tax=Phenylobacterium zucineum TaxID=284016 RepID=UPI00059D6AAB|nr:hypothetical protein [Phenylobacterium zucineum]
MRAAVVLGCAALACAGLTLGACATTSPDKTVAGLDRSDAKWKSKRCVAARKEAAAFDENKDGRMAIAVVGNLVVPFAGSAASYAMSRLKDDERQALNHKVRAACVSDPLAKRRVARR